MINRIKGTFLLLSALSCCVVSAEDSAAPSPAHADAHSRFYISLDLGSSWRLRNSWLIKPEDSFEDGFFAGRFTSNSTKNDAGFSGSIGLGYDRIYKSGFLLGGFARIGFDNSSCGGEYVADSNATSTNTEEGYKTPSKEMSFSDHSRMFTQIGIRLGVQMQEVLLFAAVAYHGTFVKSVIWDDKLDDSQDVIDFNNEWRNGVSVAIGLDYCLSSNWLLGVALATNLIAPGEFLSTADHQFTDGIPAYFSLDSHPTDMSLMVGVKRLFGKSR